MTGSYKSGTDSGSRSGADTDTTTENGSDSYSSTENVTYNKGVTTTSEQTTGNQGSKQTRTSQNEELNVSGTSTTTVTDSGSDSDVKSIEDEKSHNKTENKTKNYNSRFDNEVDEVVKTLSPEDYNLLQSSNILERFVCLFDKLFLEVFI